MVQLILGLVALYLLLAAIKQFGRLTPATAARIVRGGGLTMGLAAVLAMVARGGFGVLGMVANMLLANVLRGGGGAPFAGAFTSASAKSQVSVVRTASVEMRLDRRTGEIGGSALAGPFTGRALDSMSRGDCLALRRYCLSDDPEGARLLEAYLDRRFAAWREAEQGEREPGRRSWSGGPLSRDEAYEILGLPQGAGREEIVAAHRSLMKKLHPDHGGSTALAARVNQAKDVLLG